MKYFFVTNVGQIYYRVLPLLTDLNPKEVVIVSFPPISDFFKNHTSFPVIELKADPNLISKDPLRTLMNIRENREEYKKFFSDVWSSEIYFFGNSWKIGIFRHIDRLSLNNKIFYCPSDQSIPNHHYPSSLKFHFINFFVGFFVGIPLRVVSDSGVISFELAVDFFISNHIARLENTRKETHDFDLDLPVMEGKDILFVSEDLNMYVDGIVKKHKIIESVLEKTTKERTLLKRHPNQIEVTAAMCDLTILPSEVPSELFMSHHWKYIIGVESLALIKATQLSKATVISLLELFDYKDPKRKSDLIDWQQRESKGQILFPKTLDEFKEMIQ